MRFGECELRTPILPHPERIRARRHVCDDGTVRIGATDSGTSEGPVVYAAYANGRPILAAARRFVGGSGARWAVTAHVSDVAAGGGTSSSSSSAASVAPASLPNEGYFYIANKDPAINNPTTRKTRATAAASSSRRATSRDGRWADANVFFHSWETRDFGYSM